MNHINQKAYDKNKIMQSQSLSNKELVCKMVNWTDSNKSWSSSWLYWPILFGLNFCSTCAVCSQHPHLTYPTSDILFATSIRVLFIPNAAKGLQLYWYISINGLIMVSCILIELFEKEKKRKQVSFNIN